MGFKLTRLWVKCGHNQTCKWLGEEGKKTVAKSVAIKWEKIESEVALLLCQLDGKMSVEDENNCYFFVKNPILIIV